MPELAESLRWMHQGTELFAKALAGMDDDRLAEPSHLPGWTGKHLVAHVTANADGLGNLVHWAATGEETPQYVSAEQREADIQAGAATEPATLRAAYAESAQRLTDALSALPKEQWVARVTTRKGADIPASDIPWMRAREVMVHAVDLGGEVGFADLPAGFLGALVQDAVTQRNGTSGIPTLELLSQNTGEAWVLRGSGDSIRLMAKIADLAAWLTGRAGGRIKVLGPGAVPELPPWL